MADTAPVVPNPVTAATAITASEAARRFGAQRQAQATQNPVSDAARTLGQRAAEARKQLRTTEAPAKTQEAKTDEVEAGQHVEDDQTQLGEAQDEVTASADTPDENAPEPQDDPDAGMIDLGDGVSMTKEEVREGILLKADHTRRLMEHSEVKKQFEADRTQRLQLLDNAVVAAQQLLGQPKDPESLIEEFGMDEGMKAYFRQVKQFETLGNVIQARQQEQAKHQETLKQSTIKELSAKHGEKSEEVFSKAVQAVASKTGSDPKNVEAMLAHPEAVEFVVDALKWREMEANKPKVTKMVAGKPAVIKPGAKVSAQANAQNRVQKAEATLKQTGKLADAVALLRASRGTRTG
jgi:hypothetical protein